MSIPHCFNPNAWSRGHIEDVTFEDQEIVLGNHGIITSVIGTAQAGNWGTQAASDAHMHHYDLLFFTHGDAESAVYSHLTSAPLFGYRVSRKAVGWDLSSDVPDYWRPDGLDDGTPGELLLPGLPINLPWGAYWCILSTVAQQRGLICDTISNNNVYFDLLPMTRPIVDGQPFLFRLRRPTILNGMTPAGLASMRIDNNEVIAFRVNRRDWLP